MTERSSPREHLPLTPAVLHVLLCFADGPKHGYAIMQEVAARAEGAVRLGPGTLYGVLKRLLDRGLIEEAGAEVDEGEDRDERRRTYVWTPLGEAVARAELERLAALVRVGRGKDLLPAVAR